MKTVKCFYDKFPYPAYPLLATVRYQEGVLGQSLSVAAFCDKSTFAACSSRVLIAGCGDTQPFVFSKLEPRSKSLFCLDQSKRNLQRAKVRLWKTCRKVSFLEANQNFYSLFLCLAQFHIKLLHEQNELGSC